MHKYARMPMPADHPTRAIDDRRRRTFGRWSSGGIGCNRSAPDRSSMVVQHSSRDYVHK